MPQQLLGSLLAPFPLRHSITAFHYYIPLLQLLPKQHHFHDNIPLLLQMLHSVLELLPGAISIAAPVSPPLSSSRLALSLVSSDAISRDIILREAKFCIAVHVLFRLQVGVSPLPTASRGLNFQILEPCCKLRAHRRMHARLWFFLRLRLRLRQGKTGRSASSRRFRTSRAESCRRGR